MRRSESTQLYEKLRVRVRVNESSTVILKAQTLTRPFIVPSRLLRTGKRMEGMLWSRRHMEQGTTITFLITTTTPSDMCVDVPFCLFVRRALCRHPCTSCQQLDTRVPLPPLCEWSSPTLFLVARSHLSSASYTPQHAHTTDYLTTRTSDFCPIQICSPYKTWPTLRRSRRST